MVHDFDQQYYLQRDYVPVFPEVDYVVLKDGQRLNLGDCSLTFYKAPGHTNDSLFTVVEPYGILLAGDYLADVEFPFIFSNYTDYVHTMVKAADIMKKHQISVLVPGHGRTTDDEEEIQNRLRFSRKYLQQLLETGDMEDSLRKRYPFFDGMKGNHERNLKLAQQTGREYR